MTEAERETRFGQLADEYLDRLQRGETPTTEEYATAHVDVADLIREGFPLLRILGPVEPTIDASVPKQLGEFRVVRQIGRGGMGVVYEAIQEPLGRHVAVKVLSGSAASDPVALERFRQEARTAAGLHHTNIVPVFAVGEHAGVPYYAMQFIDGHSLSRPTDGPEALVKTPAGASTTSFTTGSLPPGVPEAVTAPSAARLSAPPNRFIAQLGLQVAEAIAHAHAQGVLHRDIKPSNLLLDAHGTIWVNDFGLAKAADGPNLTATGDVVGTLRYMAPERFHGQCDARSDIYSLGATLYEMLASQPLFGGAAGAELVERITAGRLPSLRQIDPRTPRDLETIVRKAMALAPADRYDSAASLAEDLRLFIADRPVKARRHTWPEQLWRLGRRRPATSALAASVAVLMIGIAIIGWVSAYRQRQSERDTKEKLLQAQVHQARAAILSGRPGQRIDTLATLAEAARLNRELGPVPAVTTDLRNLAAAALALPDARQQRTWNGWTQDTAGLVVDARGQLSARSDWSGNISVNRIADGTLIRAIPGPGGVAYSLKFGPDGHYLAAQYSSDTDLRIWALEGASVDRRMPILGVSDFSPDGTHIAVPNRPQSSAAPPKTVPTKTPPTRLSMPLAKYTLAKDPGVSVIDLRTGVETQHLVAAGGPNRCAFHPDGKKLAVLSRRPYLVALHDLTAAGPPRIIMEYDVAHDLAWSKDGLRLAIVGPFITVRDPDEPKDFTEIPGPGSEVTEAIFTADGLLIGSELGTFRIWDPPTRTPLLALPGQLIQVGGMAAGSDLIAFRGGKELALWEVSRSPICRPLGRSHQYEGCEVRDIDWSQDSRYLALAGPRGSAFYDSVTGREAAWIEESGNVSAESSRWIANDNELITTGAAGLFVRDIARTPEGNLKLAPFRPFGGAGIEASYECSLSANKRWAALPVGAGTRRMLVVDLKSNQGRFMAEEFPLLRYSAVSPDHRWVAASTHGEGHVNHRAIVWNAESGGVAKRFTSDEAPASGKLAFSPDGKWLVTSAGGEYRCWQVATWEPGPRINVPTAAVAGALAFDNGGKVLAITWGNNAVQLLDADTFTELVTLSTPGQFSLTSLAFNPDGDRLAVGCESGVAYVWDLRRLRTELTSLGLDWGK